LLTKSRPVEAGSHASLEGRSSETPSSRAPAPAPICDGVSTGSASFSDAKVKGNFASVREQSGIKAGDGGFQVAVNGNTTLTGGVISASQVAIDAGKNSLSTAAIKTTDLQNGDRYSANGVSLSGSVSGSLGDQSSPAAQQNMTDAQNGAAKNASKGDGLSTSPGIASQSGSQSRTTSSGVSTAHPVHEG
jgi:filamentous hemagglutinin